MSPGKIFRKTMIFNWIRLGIGMLTGFIGLLVIGLIWLLITKMSFSLPTNIALCCGAFLFIIGSYYTIMGRLGYNTQMGHLAIVEQALETSRIPSNPVEYSKTVVSERFGSNRKFYLLSRDIRISILQMRRVISRGFSLDTDLPDMSIGRWFLYVLLHPALSCADDCCLTYSLRRRDYEVHAACVDALTILVEKWRVFVRRAIRSSVIMYLACIFLFLVFFLPGLGISSSLSISSLPWMGISFLLMLTFKVAFLDSWIQIHMVCEFLKLSEETTIDPVHYDKLDRWSKAYAKLRKTAAQEAKKAGVNPIPEPPKDSSKLCEHEDSESENTPEESVTPAEDTQNVNDADDKDSQDPSLSESKS